MEEHGGFEPVTTVTTGAATAPAPPAFGHAPFTGTHRLKLPANGRVVLPAGYRKAFDDLGHVRPIDGRFLNLWTPMGFKATVDHMTALAGSAVVHPRTRKRLYASVADVSVDRQGRFVLSKELRDVVGIEPDDDIVLAGSIEAIEIWPAARYDEEEEPTMSDADLFLGNFGGLEA